MRAFILALCLSAVTAPTLQAQSATDLDHLHDLATPISKLSPPDRHAILHRLQIPASQLRAEAITLNGETSIFVQARPSINSKYCGNINCELWLFDSRHTILLQSTAESAGYLPSVHHRRNDVLIAAHNSAVEQALELWQFDGTRYRRIRCADATYGNDQGKIYKTPDINPTPCP